MAKGKTNVKSVAEPSSVTETSVATPVAETAATVRSVVVLAFPGTLDEMRQVWAKFCSEDLHFREFPDGEALVETLAEVVADNKVASDFVLVPANLIPVRPVSWEELVIPTEDVSGAGVTVWGRTPVRFDKDVLAELLPELSEKASGEEVVREYHKRTLSGIRHQVGHGFGNYYTKVLRADPCRHTLLEAFIRKHFVYSSAAGWPAVKDMLHDTVLAE